MKIHIGIDKNSGLIHSVVVTPAHVHDLPPAAQLLHGDENWYVRMLATRQLPGCRRWKARQPSFEWQSDPVNAVPYPIHLRAGCRM